MIFVLLLFHVADDAYDLPVEPEVIKIFESIGFQCREEENTFDHVYKLEDIGRLFAKKHTNIQYFMLKLFLFRYCL
jgi:hypothetical protein